MDPVEKHDNKPPNLVEPPPFDSRYLHIQRKEDMRIIRAMNAAQRQQNKSPSNMELDFSSARPFLMPQIMIKKTINHYHHLSRVSMTAIKLNDLDFRN